MRLLVWHAEGVKESWPSRRGVPVDQRSVRGKFGHARLQSGVCGVSNSRLSAAVISFSSSSLVVDANTRETINQETYVRESTTSSLPRRKCSADMSSPASSPHWPLRWPSSGGPHWAGNQDIMFRPSRTLRSGWHSMPDTCQSGGGRLLPCCHCCRSCAGGLLFSSYPRILAPVLSCIARELATHS